MSTATSHYAQQVNDSLGAEMRASAVLMNLFTLSPGIIHTAITRLPPAWRRLDAYIAGRTSVAGIMTPHWRVPRRERPPWPSGPPDTWHGDRLRADGFTPYGTPAPVLLWKPAEARPPPDPPSPAQYAGHFSPSPRLTPAQGAARPGEPQQEPTQG
ncbi:hypothetical protein ACWGHM_41255 [Streptomyces sp. NPDC054904]